MEGDFTSTWVYCGNVTSFCQRYRTRPTWESYFNASRFQVYGNCNKKLKSETKLKADSSVARPWKLERIVLNYQKEWAAETPKKNSCAAQRTDYSSRCVLIQPFLILHHSGNAATKNWGNCNTNTVLFCGGGENVTVEAEPSLLFAGNWFTGQPADEFLKSNVRICR